MLAASPGIAFLVASVVQDLASAVRVDDDNDADAVTGAASLQPDSAAGPSTTAPLAGDEYPAVTKATGVTNASTAVDEAAFKAVKTAAVAEEAQATRKATTEAEEIALDRGASVEQAKEAGRKAAAVVREELATKRAETAAKTVSHISSIIAESRAATSEARVPTETVAEAQAVAKKAEEEAEVARAQAAAVLAMVPPGSNASIVAAVSAQEAENVAEDARKRVEEVEVPSAARDAAEKGLPKPAVAKAAAEMAEKLAIKHKKAPSEVTELVRQTILQYGGSHNEANAEAIKTAQEAAKASGAPEKAAKEFAAGVKARLTGELQPSEPAQPTAEAADKIVKAGIERRLTPTVVSHQVEDAVPEVAYRTGGSTKNLGLVAAGAVGAEKARANGMTPRQVALAAGEAVQFTATTDRRPPLQAAEAAMEASQNAGGSTGDSITAARMTAKAIAMERGDSPSEVEKLGKKAADEAAAILAKERVKTVQATVAEALNGDKCSGWSDPHADPKGLGSYCANWGWDVTWCFVDPEYAGLAAAFVSRSKIYPSKFYAVCQVGK